jgi:hypothetical protein
MVSIVSIFSKSEKYSNSFISIKMEKISFCDFKDNDFEIGLYPSEYEINDIKKKRRIIINLI